MTTISKGLGHKHCLFPSCEKVGSKEFFAFPRNERSVQWLQRCSLKSEEEITHKPQGKQAKTGLCSKCCVCIDHFQDSDIVGSDRLKKLTTTAVPIAPTDEQLVKAGKWKCTREEELFSRWQPRKNGATTNLAVASKPAAQTAPLEPAAAKPMAAKPAAAKPTAAKPAAEVSPAATAKLAAPCLHTPGMCHNVFTLQT